MPTGARSVNPPGVGVTGVVCWLMCWEPNLDLLKAARALTCWVASADSVFAYLYLSLNSWASILVLWGKLATVVNVEKTSLTLQLGTKFTHSVMWDIPKSQNTLAGAMLGFPVLVLRLNTDPQNRLLLSLLFPIVLPWHSLQHQWLHHYCSLHTPRAFSEYLILWNFANTLINSFVFHSSSSRFKSTIPISVLGAIHQPPNRKAASSTSLLPLSKPVYFNYTERVSMWHFFFIKFYLFIFICVLVSVHAWVSWCSQRSGVREQISKARLLLPSCASRGLNSYNQAWWHVPLLAESSQKPLFWHFRTWI